MDVARGLRRLTLALFSAGALLLAFASPALAQVNQPPVNDFPGTQSIDEDQALPFSTGTGNAISIDDPDADPDDLRVTLNATFGRMTLATTSGLGFFNGAGGDNNGIGDTETRVQGTLAELNAALNGMTFTPDSHHNDSFGQAGMTILTDDQGNNGDGGGMTDTDAITIDVSPVAEPPEIKVPSGVGTFRDLATELSLANLNSLTADEPDSATPVNIDVEFSTPDGTLTLDDTTGLTPTGGANGSASMSFTGTDASFTGALNAGLTFTPSPGFTGEATITAETTDVDGSDVFVTDIRVDPPGEMVFWTASKNTFDPGTVPVTLPGALGRASLDGSGGGANLITGPELNDTPGGTAIDAAKGRIYWANTGANAPTVQGIWSANLDGTGRQIFLSKAQATAAGTVLDSAANLAIDQETRRLYWANNSNVTFANRGISYVSLDAAAGTPGSGGRVDTTGATINNPRGLALDLEHDRVYWTNASGGTGIATAPLPGASGTAGNFTIGGLGTAGPNGVAVDLASDPERLFWANANQTVMGDAATRLRFATLSEPLSLSITGSALDISPDPGGGLRSPAIDHEAGRIYWANGSSDSLGYANLNGTGSGTTQPAGSAFANSPDGVTILKKPEPESPPAISGTAQVGSMLTCAGATWAPDQPNGALYRVPESVELAWERDGAEIAGANGATYTPTQAGEHACVERATNFAGTATQESAGVAVSAPVTPAPQGEDPACDALRKKLKKQNAALKRAKTPGRRSVLRAKRNLTRKKLKQSGC